MTPTYFLPTNKIISKAIEIRKKATIASGD